MATQQDAREALFGHLIDHAPLFPPASLPLAQAVAEDARAAASEHAFALGRLVWPASQLAELPTGHRPLSVVLDGPLPEAPSAEAVEASYRDDLGSLAGLAGEAYVEVPLDGGLERRLDEVRAHGFLAKVRCAGGPEGLGRFLRACHARGLAYKATAGLHHAVRTDGEHGFLNLLAASVFDDEEALGERDAGRFELRADGFRWGDRLASTEEVAEARRTRLRSIGSCSFFEPVDELRALGMLRP